MRPLFSVIITAILLTACQTDTDRNKANDAQMQYETGMLAPQTSDLLAEEWKIYRAKHMDIDETTARRQFDIIQIMSAENHDPFVAAWAERRALANAWLKSEVEDVFAPHIVDAIVSFDRITVLRRSSAARLSMPSGANFSNPANSRMMRSEMPPNV